MIPVTASACLIAGSAEIIKSLLHFGAILESKKVNHSL